MTAKREVTISPTTRIEGHGKVTITLDESGNVSDAQFYATEIRGFDYFLRGMEADRLPFIISRICGVCSTAHIIASVEAIEKIYQTEITETASRLRELLLLGQIINNHSLVCYFLTLPDFWFRIDEDPSRRNIFQIMRDRPDIGRKAITLRRFGASILDVVGKREVHIFSVIPGGLINPLKEREREKLLEEAKVSLKIAEEALTMGRNLFEQSWSSFQKAGDFKTHYMALTNNDAVEFYKGRIRVINEEGATQAEFPAEDYMEHVEEKTYPWTYARFAFLRSLDPHDRIVQVGPTARINVNKHITTSGAESALLEFKRRFGSPTHATILQDYARLIDLLYAVEKAKMMLDEENLLQTDTRVTVNPKAGRGVGVVEAPRGTLAHEYTLSKEGRLDQLRLIIPTQINSQAINFNVKDAASEFIKNGEVKSGLLNRVEMVIRAYDPCIKCATRNVGTGINVEVRRHDGTVLQLAQEASAH